MLECRRLDPPFYLAHPFLQTAFASLKFRVSGEMLRAHSEFRMITTKAGVRLLGSLARQLDRPAKGLVLLIHGWEGGIESTYMLRTGEFLFREGWNVFRLNLRDHGDTHHLNEAPFNGTMIEESFEAIRIIAGTNRLPFYIMGFSLGGNFVLRAALKHSTRKSKIANLRHVIAVSPAVAPEAATLRIDEDFILRRYFLKKWSQSLLKKEALFPHLHNFQFAKTARSVMELTEIGIPRFTPYQDLADYFSRYTLTGPAFACLDVPCTIFTAKDDPIIREEDFRTIEPSSHLRVILSDRGGHNGFITSPSFHCAYLDLFQEVVQQTGSIQKGQIRI